MDFSQQPFFLHLTFTPRHCRQERVSDFRVSRSDLGSSVRQGHLNSFARSQLSNQQTERKYRDKLCNMTDDVCTVGLASELHKPTTIFSGTINFPYSDSDFFYREMAMHSHVCSWRKELPRHWSWRCYLGADTGEQALACFLKYGMGQFLIQIVHKVPEVLAPYQSGKACAHNHRFIPLHPFQGQPIRMMLSSAVWSQLESRLLVLPSPAIPLLLRIDIEKLLKTWSLLGIQNSQPHNQPEGS